MPKVGIIANPVSARDIRRIVAYAGNLPINDRANIVLRILAGLQCAGVEEAVIMPENRGIRFHLMRAVERERKMGHHRFPAIRYLDMSVTGTADDSARAARMMREEGVAAIAVLGGDGTHRVVASQCGNIPIAGVSTGTSNAFPEMREPTITGMAIGFFVTRQIPSERALAYNKRFEVKVNDSSEIALVDVAVVADRYVGARAIWKTESFRDLFVTFGRPDGIGMSSIIGQLAPLGREERQGRRVRLIPPEQAPHHLAVPIAPGMIEEVGIGMVETVSPDMPYLPSVAAGALALDGELELTFSETDDVSIRLQLDAFRTIDVPGCMAYAAQHGLLVRAAEERPRVAQPRGRPTDNRRTAQQPGRST